MSTMPQPSPNLVTVAHVVYALHAVGLAIGALGAATIVGSFIFGWPSIIAVIINYVKRSEARGTWLESHFSWQIRTFWYAVVWAAVGFMTFVTIIGLPIAIAIFITLSIWAIYRIARGWLRLKDGQAMPA